MRVYLNNTRDLSICRALKADELRVWAGLLSMIEHDLEVPPRAMIAKRCLIMTSKVTLVLRTLTEHGFLMDAEPKVNPKYVSFRSRGKGSAPFAQESLRDFSRNRTLFVDGLRLFYYLLGDIRKDNKVLDSNIAGIARELGADRGNTSRWITKMKNENFLTEEITDKVKTYTISPNVLGVLKGI